MERKRVPDGWCIMAERVDPKSMFLNMDFRMTTLIPFLVFCLCMTKIFIYFFFFCKTVQMLSYKLKHVPSLIMAVFVSVN